MENDDGANLATSVLPDHGSCGTLAHAFRPLCVCLGTSRRASPRNARYLLVSSTAHPASATTAAGLPEGSSSRAAGKLLHAGARSVLTI